MALALAPITRSTSLPSLKEMMVGIEDTRYLAAISLAASVSSLHIFTFPAAWSASSSINGAMALHGGHQVAQKSTTTGTSDFSTSASKFCEFK